MRLKTLKILLSFSLKSFWPWGFCLLCHSQALKAQNEQVECLFLPPAQSQVCLHNIKEREFLKKQRERFPSKGKTERSPEDSGRGLNSSPAVKGRSKPINRIGTMFGLGSGVEYHHPFEKSWQLAAWLQFFDPPWGQWRLLADYGRGKGERANLTHYGLEVLWVYGQKNWGLMLGARYLHETFFWEGLS